MRWLLCVCVLYACGDDSDLGRDAARDAGGTDTSDGSASDGSDDVRADAAAPLAHVLFVGNSYTYFNDLPVMVAQIGEASGTPLEVEMIAPGGATLYQHFTSTGARERIEMGDLDAVVLQGQSQEAGGPGWIEAATSFAEILTGTQTVWYATWARHGDAFSNPVEGPAVMNANIERGYRDAAAINGDLVARVGAAWELARLELPEVRLHQDDLSHPRPEGSLIAACVIHRTLTGRASVLSEPAPHGIEQNLAEQLCALASRLPCPFEHLECGGACISIVDDVDNCGGCGVTCESGDPCMGGACGCAIEGYSGCDGEYCADLSGDERNCGGCGIECSGGEACATGTCECPDARVYDLFGVGLPPCHMDAMGAERLGCNAAGHAYCAAYECFTSGYAYPTGHAPRIESAACLRDTESRTTTLTELATHEASCADALTPACVTAIHRYCIAEGFASGFGPIAVAGDELTVTCLADANLVSVDATTLAPFASRCTPDPITCGVAAWEYCASVLLHPGGFGPVEPDTIVCF